MASIGLISPMVRHYRKIEDFTDDLSDLYRVCSTLYEEIARDVFVMRAGVFYCTDIDECPLCCEVKA